MRWDPRPSRCVPKQRAGRAQHPLPVRCWGLLPLTESLEAICLLKKSVPFVTGGRQAVTALPAPARIQFAKSKHPSPKPPRFCVVLGRFVPPVALLPSS